MSTIVERMKGKPFFHQMTPAAPEDIEAAQAALGLRFADDYTAYVLACGAASFDGKELTGVCKSPRLNVVAVTQEERGLNPAAKANWYVLEQLHIDGVVLWQDASGAVYQTMPGAPACQVATSLSDYIDS